MFAFIDVYKINKINAIIRLLTFKYKMHLLILTVINCATPFALTLEYEHVFLSHKNTCIKMLMSRCNKSVS